MAHATTDAERAEYAAKQAVRTRNSVASARTSLASKATDESVRWSDLAGPLNAVASAQARADVWSQVNDMAQQGYTNYDALLWSIATQQVNDRYSGSGQEAERAYAEARRQEVVDARWALGLAS